MAADTLLIESREFALELHRLLQALDPVRLRDELRTSVEERYEEVRARFEELHERFAERDFADEAWQRLADSVTEIRASLETICEREADGANLSLWQRCRDELKPKYNELAESLAGLSQRVPRFRSTNYKRSLFHVTSGLVGVVVVEFFVQPQALFWPALAFAVFAWTCELGRYLDPKVNDKLMAILGPLAHPHEHTGINSGTWFCTALLGLALTQSTLLAATGLLVTAIADPVAGFVGRRWGTIQIAAQRTLQGSVAFLLSGGVAVYLLVMLLHPEIGVQTRLAICVSASLFGAIVELYVNIFDDNLTIPLASAFGAWIAVALF